MTNATSDFKRTLNRYGNLKTIPALLSIIFALSSLYQFGGIAEVHIVWIEYTLTTEHAMLVSLLTYAVAFASSETKDFDHYEDWEKAFIAASPALILFWEFTNFIPDGFHALGSTAGGFLAFVIAVGGWGVAVR